MNERTKHCPRCNTDKPLTDYNTRKDEKRAGQPQSYCRTCQVEYQRERIRTREANVRIARTAQDRLREKAGERGVPMSVLLTAILGRGLERLCPKYGCTGERMGPQAALCAKHERQVRDQARRLTDALR